MTTLKKYISPFDSLLGNWLNEELVGLPVLDHSQRSLPAVNLIENKNSFSIEIAAPGFDKKDFLIELDNYNLTVSLEKEVNENVKYFKKEFDYSSFTRSFKLPKYADLNKIDAEYKNGILHLSVYKKKEAIALPKKTINIS